MKSKHRHCATKQVAGPKLPFSDFGVAGPDTGKYFCFIHSLKKCLV